MCEKVKLTQEAWRPIKGFEGFYEVSNLGNIRSLDRVITDKRGRSRNLRGKVLKKTINTYGYEVVCLRKPTKKLSRRVHRLVAKAFIPKIKGKQYINHIDGDKLNNSANNLEWCTSSENMKHAFESGIKNPSNPNKNGNLQGSKHHKSKLTERDVKFIRRNSRHNGGSMKNTELARLFEVNKTTIGYVVNNKTWTHVS